MSLKMQLVVLLSILVLVFLGTADARRKKPRKLKADITVAQIEQPASERRASIEKVEYPDGAMGSCDPADATNGKPPCPGYYNVGGSHYALGCVMTQAADWPRVPHASYECRPLRFQQQGRACYLLAECAPPLATGGVDLMCRRPRVGEEEMLAAADRPYHTTFCLPLTSQ